MQLWQSCHAVAEPMRFVIKCGAVNVKECVTTEANAARSRTASASAGYVCDSALVTADLYRRAAREARLVSIALR